MTVRANQYRTRSCSTVFWLQPAQTIRRWVAIARDDRLSLFATGDAARYLKEKPIPFTLSPLRVVVIIPSNGATVHGKQVLDASVSDQFSLTKVDYFLSGLRACEDLDRHCHLKQLRLDRHMEHVGRAQRQLYHRCHCR